MKRTADLPLRLAAPLLALLLALLSIDTDLVGSWDDDALYLSVARSLSNGDGLVADVLPGLPRVGKYPPVYPLLLAGLMKLGLHDGRESGLWLLLAVNACFFAGAVYLVVNVLLPRLGAAFWQRWSALVLLSVSAPLLRVVGSALSESLYTLLLVGQLSALGAWSAGGLALPAVLTRTAHVAAAAGDFLAALVNRRWRRAAALAVAVVLAFLVLLSLRQHVEARQAAVPPQVAQLSGYYAGYDSHLGYYLWTAQHGGLTGLVSLTTDILRANTAHSLHGLKELFYPHKFTDPLGEAVSGLLGAAEKLLALLLLLSAAAGLWLTRPARPLLAVLVAYTLVFLFWTWPFTLRFWVPVFPLVVTGLALAAGRFGARGRIVLLTLVATSALLNLVVLAGQVSSQTGGTDDSTEQSQAAQRWLETHLSGRRGDVLLAGLDTQWHARRLGLQGQWLDTMTAPDYFYSRMIGVRSRPTPVDLSENLWPRLQTLRNRMPADALLVLHTGVGMRDDMVEAVELLAQAHRIERLDEDFYVVPTPR